LIDLNQTTSLFSKIIIKNNENTIFSHINGCIRCWHSCAEPFGKCQKKASQNKELILLNFSGSDWCIPCIKLHKNIIETDEFKKLETENIAVYINADFPRNKRISFLRN
jgi:thiol-disulfide isomerase/thioredoxin